MKKVTKILSAVLVLALVLTMSVVLFACNKPDNTPTGTNFSVKVVDLDGEVVLDKALKLQEGETVFGVLKENADVVYTGETDEKAMVTSINGTYVGTDYYMMFNHNNKPSKVGIGQVECKEGDTFEFYIAYFGKHDAADQAIDKTVYKFFKELKKEYATRTTCYDGHYYADMAISLYKQYYDKRYTVDMSDEFKNSINADVAIDPQIDWKGNVVSNVDLVKMAKYYYALKAHNMDLTKFKTTFTEQLNTLGSDYAFSAWTSPYIFGVAKALGIDNTVITSVLDNLKVSTDTTHDVDTAINTNIAYAFNKKATAEELKPLLKMVDYTKLTVPEGWSSPAVTSNGFILAQYSANGIDVRKEQATLGVEIDQIEYLASVIDSKSGLILVNPNQGVLGANNYAVDQMYLSLLSYMICRDNSDTIINIYA